MSDVIGVLHPGAMGGGIAGFLASRGNKVLWVSANRSPETRKRAQDGGLTEVPTMADLASQATLIFSICPPEFAMDVAQEAIAGGFRGTYCDANAIAPSTSQKVGALVESVGASFVDGGIIGGPPPSGNVSLYFSGDQAPTVAALFGGEEKVRSYTLEGSTTAASTLKMTYAAWTKGSQALILAVRAAAMVNGVEEGLLREWARSHSDAEAHSDFARQQIFKAWRFAGEMREIAKCFAESGVTPNFHVGAEEVFASCASLKDQKPAPEMETVLQLIAAYDEP